MKKVKIVVTYTGKLDEKLDRKIKNIMEHIGAECMGGFNFMNKQRDILFNLKI